MIYYKIHELVEVHVDTAVRGHVRESIDFQIGHFKAAAALPYAEIPVIRYLPYACFSGGGSTEFHTVRGEAGRLLHASDMRFAIVVSGCGFDVFTDTSEVLVNILIQIIVLRKGLSFMHAAGWVDERGGVTLLPGPGGVGKTALLSAGIMRRGVRLLGDDLVLAGKDGRAWSFPRSFVLKPYHRSQYPDHYPKQSSAWRAYFAPLMAFLKANLPFRGLIRDILRKRGNLEPAAKWMNHGFTGAELYPVPVAELFGPECVADGGVIDRVVYLERREGGEFSKTAMTTEALAARCMAVLQHEWVDYGRWVNQLGALELFWMTEHHRAVEQAMMAACERAEKWLVQVPSEAQPEDLERWFLDKLGFTVGKP